MSEGGSPNQKLTFAPLIRGRRRSVYFVQIVIMMVLPIDKGKRGHAAYHFDEFGHQGLIIHMLAKMNKHSICALASLDHISSSTNDYHLPAPWESTWALRNRTSSKGSRAILPSSLFEIER